MENQERLIKKCVNCGTEYNLKGGMPEICWACGMPTDERPDEYGNF